MEATIQPQGKVSVLGGGIVGITAAIELSRSGYEVTLIDRGEPADSTAATSAGQLCFSHVDPMIDAKSLREIPFQLLRSDGSLFVNKNYLKSKASWFKAALLSCRPSSVERTMVAMAALNKIAWESLERQCQEAGIADNLGRIGVLYAYTTKAAWKQTIDTWERKSALGVKWSMVSPAVLPEMVPALHLTVECAIHAEEDCNVTDTKKVVEGLAAHATAIGVKSMRRQVEGVEIAGEGKVRVILDGGESLESDGCIVALGAWSDKIAGQLGDKVLLASQRGYNQTYPEPKVQIGYPVIVEDQGLAITPLATGLRVGGWVEFDDMDKPPTEKIHARLTKVATNLLTGLDTKGASQWMGNRPSTPDSLPVIGPSSKARNVIYAFGHGHLGLTQSAATARCVADLAAGINPPVALAPFGIERFD